MQMTMDYCTMSGAIGLRGLLVLEHHPRRVFPAILISRRLQRQLVVCFINITIEYSNLNNKESVLPYGVVIVMSIGYSSVDRVNSYLPWSSLV
jgi:hypothetical protein